MKQMLTLSIRFLALTALLLSTAVNAQPTTLKLWFFTSENSTTYQCHVRPLVDAVNNEQDGALRIDVTFGTGIRPLEDRLKPIMDGSADITIATPTYAQARFRDNAVLQLPGLFRDQIESIRVYKALVEAGAMSGYQDLFVLGTFLSLGESIHSRKPTATLSDLRGQNIRVNSEIEAITLRRFGANPVILPITQTMDGLGQGTIDGVTIPTPAVFDFGIGRMTANHYLLTIGPIPTILVMTRAKFSSLPATAQETIRKHTGRSLAERAASCMEAKDREITARLQSDSRRKVTLPSSSDRDAAERVFAEVVQEWAAQNPRNAELLVLVKAEIAKLRSAK